MTNLDSCDRLGTTPCEGMYDGSAVHQGLEAGAHWAAGQWRLDGSMTLLDAKRRGSVAEPSTNGQRPINVPKIVARAKATYLVPMVPGLAIDALVSHEGNRAVLPDQSIMLPSWTRFDAAVRYTTKVQGVTTRWIAGVDNIADRRYWRESPTQFGHVYLFAGAPRTFRLALQADF
jgi:iron complex outermembrane receptor protein